MIREMVIMIGMFVLSFAIIWMYGIVIEPLAADIGVCSLQKYGGDKLCNDIEFVMQVLIPMILSGGGVVFALRRSIRTQKTTVGPPPR